MTTIVFRHGVLASDSQTTSSNLRMHGVTKCIKTDTYLAGGCGHLETLAAWLDWVEGGMQEDKKPEGNDKSTLFLIDKRGFILEYDEKMYPMKVGKHPFFAWGSGRDFALGALECGATAVEAVRVAAKYDIYTGGRIKTLQL